ncbi:Tetratricopeptide TPR1 [Phaffia rhodozyma]|uniref:Tetratricopeptide TPR1 n=1 Tax=Phaffia rhodozyma TaxID=264483 RepID=A0A0F7SG59_PHARH|nr:Tetratricopeptide TPR1 [Phaffia rhodozyma]
MARTKTQKRADARPAAATTTIPSTSTAAVPIPVAGQQLDQNVDSLLLKSHTLLAQQNYELAQRFLTRLLALEPSNAEARELIGVCELELGNAEAARDHFLVSLQAPLQTSSAPYLYLAQLASSPQEALNHYEAAVKILDQQLTELVQSKQTGVEDTKELEVAEGTMRKQISTALVGMTEIYLTDLCFEPLAEEKCNLLLQKALSVLPTDPEAWICLASVRTSQQRPEEAIECIEKGWAEWRDRELGDPLIPSIQTRLSLARLLLEYHRFSEATTLLRGVLDEDDEDVEAAYLEGWAWFLRGEQIEDTEEEVVGKGKGKEVGSEGDEDELSKVDCWEEAREILSVCQVLHQSQNYPQIEILAHVNEMLAALDKAGIRPAQGVVDEGDMEAIDGEGQDWEDDDDDEDEDMA